MKKIIYKDNNINTWFISLYFIEIPIWMWGFGIDLRIENGFRNVWRSERSKRI